jgi:hypothetical protein
LIFRRQNTLSAVQAFGSNQIPLRGTMTFNASDAAMPKVAALGSKPDLREGLQ